MGYATTSIRIYNKPQLVNVCSKYDYKRFLKRNQPNVGMAGWRHWLTKYTDKESTFNNIATFHTTSSSEYCATYSVSLLLMFGMACMVV